MMNASTYASGGSILAAVLCAAWAFIERFRKERAEDAKRTAQDAHKIIEVKDELIKVAQEARCAWKEKYETEHAEYIEYRKNAHDQLNKANIMVLKHTEEVADLRAKTDMTPIKQHMEQQTEVNSQIIQALVKINTTQDLLIESIMANFGAHKAVKQAEPKEPK